MHAHETMNAHENSHLRDSKGTHWVARSVVDMADLKQEAFKIVLETAVITEKYKKREHN